MYCTVSAIEWRGWTCLFRLSENLQWCEPARRLNSEQGRPADTGDDGEVAGLSRGLRDPVAGRGRRGVPEESTSVGALAGQWGRQDLGSNKLEVYRMASELG